MYLMLQYTVNIIIYYILLIVEREMGSMTVR
jgi:hypothetical protein